MAHAVRARSVVSRPRPGNVKLFWLIVVLTTGHRDGLYGAGGVRYDSRPADKRQNALLRCDGDTGVSPSAVGGWAAAAMPWRDDDDSAADTMGQRRRR